MSDTARMDSRRLGTVGLLCALLMAAGGLPATAQEARMSLSQLERQYPRMSPVHIRKCDRNGDDQYTRTEQLCVSSIYQTMYLNRN
ncbi:MAG: hypothetical protein QM699_06790 [Amaricoccus sp.]|uniref:hypothetical protein n=1 Tax=Amaricoccus sp. TaxID=1872485 RepID=UPI0039E61BB1